MLDNALAQPDLSGAMNKVISMLARLMCTLGVAACGAEGHQQTTTVDHSNTASRPTALWTANVVFAVSGGSEMPVAHDPPYWATVVVSITNSAETAVPLHVVQVALLTSDDRVLASMRSVDSLELVQPQTATNDWGQYFNAPAQTFGGAAPTGTSYLRMRVRVDHPPGQNVERVRVQLRDEAGTDSVVTGDAQGVTSTG